MSAALAIQARGLKRHFRDGRVRALDGVDLDVAAKSSVAITGPSGSGKTTLLYALSGLLRLDAGTVGIAGLQPETAADWTRLRRERIGLVFQDDWLLPALTVAQNVEIAMHNTRLSMPQRRARTDELLHLVNAHGFADRRPAELSGGERQRVAVARGLANTPSILLADEPTGELDYANSDRIADLLFDLQRSQGLTLLLVTHERDLARRCALQFVMRDGRGSFEPDGFGQ